MKVETKILLIFLTSVFLGLFLSFYFKNKTLATTCGNGICEAGENCSNCSIDCSATCGNGVCESSCGENSLNCSIDCGPTCGNGVCESGETCSNCPIDCGSCGPTCGNGICETGETCSNCSIDCGVCPPTCGNGKCETGENCQNCKIDCPTPTCGNGVCESNCGEGPSNCCLDCYEAHYTTKCYDNDVYWYDCNVQRKEKYQECGDSGWTNEYQCSGNIVQRKYATRGCSNAQCYTNYEWKNYQDCSLEGKICVSGQCFIPSVDLKANNSDGPITIAYKNRTISLSWASQYLNTCTAETYSKPYGSNVNWSGTKSTSGSESVTLDKVGSFVFKITCKHTATGITKSDSVQVTLQQPTLSVITKGVVVTY